jgi:hypothetical protein
MRIWNRYGILAMVSLVTWGTLASNEAAARGRRVMARGTAWTSSPATERRPVGTDYSEDALAASPLERHLRACSASASGGALADETYAAGAALPDQTPPVNPLPAFGPAPRIAVMNPAELGIPVKFLVDGQPVELGSGQYVDLGPLRPNAITFHRGGSFGTTNYRLTEGVFTFTATPDGLNLARGDAALLPPAQP